MWGRTKLTVAPGWRELSRANQLDAADSIYRCRQGRVVTYSGPREVRRLTLRFLLAYRGQGRPQPADKTLIRDIRSGAKPTRAREQHRIREAVYPEKQVTSSDADH